VTEGDPRELLTVGHGTATQTELVERFTAAGVRSIVDVRRFPGSRRHPHVGRAELERWLPASGIDYRWEERLGGRRRPDPASVHLGLRNVSFRAYADHLGSDAFQAAIADVLAESDDRRVAVLCSESLWWRCHRRLIADHVELVAGFPVQHLSHDGRLARHRPTDVVRVVDGRLVYDAGEPPLEL
jgi:uncharacterized protein (DUF488 family)